MPYGTKKTIGGWVRFPALPSSSFTAAKSNQNMPAGGLFSTAQDTIHRDFNLVSMDEVMALVKGDASGRIQR